MRKKIVKPERRRSERRSSRLSALGDAVAESSWSDRRVQCWNLDPECDEARRKRCAAYFLRRNCWDLWAAEYFPPGRRPCCHPEAECSECSLASAKFRGPMSIYVAVPPRPDPALRPDDTASSASYCHYLYNFRDGLVAQRPEVKVRTDFKCHRRPGIMLHQTYVSDVCSCREHRECTFYGTE